MPQPQPPRSPALPTPLKTFAAILAASLPFSFFCVWQPQAECMTWKGRRDLPTLQKRYNNCKLGPLNEVPHVGW